MIMKRRPIAPWLTLALVAGTFAIARPAAWADPPLSTTDLGALSTQPDRYSFSDPVAVNASGQVAGYSNILDGNTGIPTGADAFLYSSSPMQDLGSLGAGPDVYSYSYATALNSSGQIVGSSDKYEDSVYQGTHAFLYSNGQMIDLSQFMTDPGLSGIDPSDGVSKYSDAYAINDSGQVVGRSAIYDADGNQIWHAFLFSNGQMKTLTLGGQPDISYSYATAINASGQVVGSSDVYEGGVYKGSHAFLYSNGQMIDLSKVDPSLFGTNPDDGTSFSYAFAINASGQVAGISDVYKDGVSRGTHAFLYSNGQMQDLGVLSEDASQRGFSSPASINSSGQVVGYSNIYKNGNFKGTHAFLYSNGAMQDLGALGEDSAGNVSSSAIAINDAGEVIGNSNIYDGANFVTEHAFLYSDGQMKDLNTLIDSSSGITLVNARAINASGQIACFAHLASGAQRAVLLSPATAANQAPTADDQSVTTNAGTPQAVTLTGSDPDAGDTLTFTVTTQPQHGQLSGSGASLTYTPTAGYSGSDSFQFKVTDSHGADSNIATVSISVNPINHAPVADAGADQSKEATGSTTSVHLDGSHSSDPDGDSLTYEWKEGSTVLGTGMTLSHSFSVGVHTLTLTVMDPSNASASDKVTITITDTTAPSISGLPSSIVVSAAGTTSTVVTFTAPTATDLVDGMVPVTCTPESGASFPLGKTTVNCTAKDNAGNMASASFLVWVQYTWSGFSMKGDDGGSIKAGSTVPVKFQLTGASANITNAVASLSYAKLSGGVPGPSSPATSTSAATSGNLFRYSGGQYIFNWSTKGLAAGMYRVTVDLGDGVDRHYDVTLR